MEGNVYESYNLVENTMINIVVVVSNIYIILYYIIFIGNVLNCMYKTSLYSLARTFMKGNIYVSYNLVEKTMIAIVAVYSIADSIMY